MSISRIPRTLLNGSYDLSIGMWNLVDLRDKLSKKWETILGEIHDDGDDDDDDVNFGLYVFQIKSVVYCSQGNHTLADFSSTG